MYNPDMYFYKNKRVFVTGHTGFKGSWLCQILKEMGAIVTGYALEMGTENSLFQIANISNNMNSYIGDIREFSTFQKVFQEADPEIVFHLAAQPIVRESYQRPVYTYETNVLGTVYLLECVRNSKNVKSVLNVTTDKVYDNKEWEWGYRENDALDGYDVYSNSKSCSELVTHSYQRSFLNERNIAVSTVRAGNVIGGGDFEKDRIIPDCIRAAIKGEEIIVRNPNSIRPYQFVLEPLIAYLMIAQQQYKDIKFSGNYNVGPDEGNCVTTGKLVQQFVETWGEELKWRSVSENGPHEANYLKLDCSRIKNVFQWKPVLGIDKAVEKTVEWTKCWMNGQDIVECMNRQINDFLK